MDNSARWFLGGIVVSLINTGLVLAFIGIPGITDRDGETVRLEQADIRAIAAAVVGRREVDGVAAAVASEAVFEVGVPDACLPDVRPCVAADLFVPYAVAVAPGESVTFNINGASHQVAVYGPGVRPADIDTTLVGGVADTEGAGRTIIDPNRRIAESPDLPFAPAQATRWEWDTPGFAPGTYLVICTFQPHFDVGMYGWVIVK